MRPDTQLGDLHRYWDFGSSAWAAIKAGTHFNFIAFAALFVTLTPINGPLLQRSTSITTGSAYGPVDLKIEAARSIDYVTGMVSGRAFGVALISDNYLPVVQDFYNGVSIAANHSGCAGDGTCSGRLAAAGWAVNCSSYSEPFSVEPKYVEGQSYDPSSDPAMQNGTYGFMSNFLWSVGTPGELRLNVQYKGEAACSGDLTVQNCSLYASTVQYPVVIDGNSSTITLDPRSTMFDDVVMNRSEYAVIPTQGGTQLGGYAFALQNRFDSTSHLRWVGGSTSPTTLPLGV